MEMKNDKRWQSSVSTADQTATNESQMIEKKSIWPGLKDWRAGQEILEASSNWLSKRKFVVVCYEKVVRIPLEGDEIFRVHGKRTLGAAKALMNAKVDETRISDIPVEWNFGDDQLSLRWMIYLVVLADAAESVRDVIGFKYCLASSSEWTKSHVLWAEIKESSLTGLERKSLESEVGDRVLLKVLHWKGIVRFGKKGKLTLRYVGPFEILERIGLVAYRLRLPEELNSVHDTFHVSNLKKWLGNANLHCMAICGDTGNERVLHAMLLACRDLEVAFEYPGEYRDDKKVVRKSG
ncbi:hypothetical protein Tco_0301125 [Tanacetum coccineum]